jgi:putative addiction module killer protein
MFTVLKTEQYDAWFDDISDKVTRNRITARIKRIEQGNLGDIRSIGDGVSEMRLDFGPGYRLYFTQRGFELIILLCGGDKSSQKRDIKRAKTLAAQLDTE